MRPWVASKAAAGFVVGVAITLAGAVMLSSSDAAAGPGDVVPGAIDATFVPITPCRLFDLRTSEIGLRSAPLAPGEKLILQVRGEQGNCNLPDDVIGVSMNVTIVEPTAASYLTVFPVRANRPLSSNLNWVAGQGATPNKVDVAVSKDGSSVGGGKVAFYNAFGTVYVIADVFGYYTDATLDEITQRMDEIATGTPFLFGPQDSWESPSTGLHKVTATATIDLDTSGVDAGTCTIRAAFTNDVERTIERLDGQPVEFSDEGIPESQMRIPITVVQVFRYTITKPPDGDFFNYGSFSLECTPTSGAFDVLDESIIWEVHRNPGWNW